MDARTVNNLPPAATHDGAVRCLMAIELSKRSWIVAINTPLSDKISNHTVKGWNELLELIDKIRSRVGRELKRPVEVVSCYEAGYDGFWVHRLLEENGVRNYVIDPASLQVDRRARRVKTDNAVGVVAKEGLPALRRRPPSLGHVFRDRGLADINSQFEEFAVNPWCSPQWVGNAHLANQLANVRRRLRPAAARS